MPRGRQLTPEEEAAERAAMGGFPQDGDEFAGADDPPEDPPAPAPAPAPVDPLADMRARMDRLERDNEALRRQIPPAAPKSPAPAPTPGAAVSAIDQVDWDKELFASPKDAIKKAIQIAREETSRELRAEYQRDRGTTQFWDKFYRLHPDLRDDHDLVEVTLNSNLSDLANIRVEDAYTKLADLTRERILRYAGGAARKRPKARAEGVGGVPASSPTPTPNPDQNEPKVTSLSDLLRVRRQNRKAGAA